MGDSMNIPLAVVGPLIAAMGLVFAVLIGRARTRERAARLEGQAARVRSDFLARVSTLIEAGADPLARIGELAASAVPDLADLCVVDLVDGDGRIVPSGVAADDPARESAIWSMREEFPVDPESDHPVAQVVATGRASLMPTLTTEDLERFTATSEHAVRLREIGFRSAVIAPLTARGRVVGTFALVRLGERVQPYEQADLDLLVLVARRAGLAIDHARLFDEVANRETELRTILEAMVEAVTVQDPASNLVYANQAAADLCGVADPETLLREGMAGMAELWDVRTEDGGDLDWEALPGRRVLLGEPAEPLLVLAHNRETGEQRWRVLKASAVKDASGAVRLAVNVIEDVTETKRQEFTQRFLANASKMLGSSLDPDVTVEKVAWAAVPELADWCAVDMPDDHGRLRRVATADTAPERTRRSTLIVQDRSGDDTLPIGPPQVMRTGRSEYYPDITDDLLRLAAADEAQLQALRDVQARSAIVVPLVVREQVIGTLTLGTAESRRRLEPADLELSEELGRRAAVAVDNARTHSERSKIAATLQDALLPPRLPVIPDLTIAARFRAAGEASEVGGDFYDLVAARDAWMIIIGDVTGKGPAAAAITSIARYTMRTAAMYESDPKEILRRLNSALMSEEERRQLCTAVCARVVPRGDGGATVAIACAGHPPPLHIGARPGVRPIGAPGTLLGAFDDGEWHTETVELRAGESLVLYTDGVTDTRGTEDRFGSDRLEALLGGLGRESADQVAASVDSALLEFQHGAQRDDVALLVLQATRPGAAEAETSMVGTVMDIANKPEIAG